MIICSDKIQNLNGVETVVSLGATAVHQPSSFNAHRYRAFKAGEVARRGAAQRFLKSPKLNPIWPDRFLY